MPVTFLFLPTLTGAPELEPGRSRVIGGPPGVRRGTS